MKHMEELCEKDQSRLVMMSLPLKEQVRKREGWLIDAVLTSTIQAKIMCFIIGLVNKCSQINILKLCMPLV